jgi:hypothetical protein
MARPPRTVKEKAKRPDIPPPPIETRTTPTGQVKLVNPSPLKGMKRPERIRYMIGIMEYAAVHGNVDAARHVAAHERWAEEMKAGRPPLRGKVDIDHSVTLVDDIGRTHQPTRRLPEGEHLKAKAPPSLPAPHKKPTVPPTSDNNVICKPGESPQPRHNAHEPHQ